MTTCLEIKLDVAKVRPKIMVELWSKDVYTAPSRKHCGEYDHVWQDLEAVGTCRYAKEYVNQKALASSSRPRESPYIQFRLVRCFPMTERECKNYSL